MAKLTAPLLSLRASGSINKTLTFFNCEHFSFVRSKRSPVKNADIPTAGRLAQRAIYSQGIQAWKYLTDEERIAYNELKYPLSQTGFNRFMSKYLKEGGEVSTLPYLLPRYF